MQAPPSAERISLLVWRKRLSTLRRCRFKPQWHGGREAVFDGRVSAQGGTLCERRRNRTFNLLIKSLIFLLLTIVNQVNKSNHCNVLQVLFMVMLVSQSNCF